jgi:hypothetical protein
MAEALQAYDALTEAGIYAHVSRTNTGPVIIVSQRDAPAASKIFVTGVCCSHPHMPLSSLSAEMAPS